MENFVNFVHLSTEPNKSRPTVKTAVENLSGFKRSDIFSMFTFRFVG